MASDTCAIATTVRVHQRTFVQKFSILYCATAVGIKLDGASVRLTLDAMAPLLHGAPPSRGHRARTHGAHLHATDVHLVDACRQGDCDAMRAIVEAHAAGRWTRDRHEEFPTTDIPVERLPGLRALAEAVVASAITPFISRTWGVPADCVRVHDLFVVDYSCELGGQRALKPHQDESHFS